MDIKLQPTIVFTVRENSYKVEQPNIGQIIDIEMIKAQITGGNYGKMVSNFSRLSILSLDIIDMFAHFKILCPELIEDLKVESWGDLEAFDALDIHKAYKEQFKPWIDSFSEALLKVWDITVNSLKDEKPAKE